MEDLPSPVDAAEMRRQRAYHAALAARKRTREADQRSSADQNGAEASVHELIVEKLDALLIEAPDPGPPEPDLSLPGMDPPRGVGLIRAILRYRRGVYLTPGQIAGMARARNWMPPLGPDDEQHVADGPVRAALNRCHKAGLVDKRAVDGRTFEYAWIQETDGGEP